MAFMDQFRSSSYFYAITDRIVQEYGNYTLEPKGKTGLSVFVVDTEGPVCVGVISPLEKHTAGANLYKYKDARTGEEWVPPVNTAYGEFQ